MPFGLTTWGHSRLEGTTFPFSTEQDMSNLQPLYAMQQKKLSWSSQFSCFCALLKFSGVPAMRGLDTQRLIAGNTLCHLFVEAEQWSWIIGFQAASTLAKLSEDKNQKHLITEIQTLQNDSEANALMGVERIGRVPRENKNKANKDVSREGVKFLYWGLLETCLCRVL